ncbi:hypothetical protein DRW03_35850 [Corallococcus sp. H22C18031201]|nr:hypothetical protein DRW03_35850 [Corallococcus sp. H22C18031201]
MIGAEDPRVEAQREWSVVGLDYDFMQRQGWLFENCLDEFKWLCEYQRQHLTTPSLKTLDALVAYLGEWLRAGDYEGGFQVNVWRDLGTPEQVETHMGAHDGYSVEWCRPEEHGRSVIVLTPTPSSGEAGVEHAERRRGQNSPGCHARFATYRFLASFELVDETIASLGRDLREGRLSGEVVIGVIGPHGYVTPPYAE